MRTTVILAFVVAAFAAVLAAPSASKVSIKKIEISPIALHLQTKVALPHDLIGDLIQLIGQFYGLNPSAIRYQAEDLLNTIETEIPAALNTIVAAAGAIDDQLAARYTALLNNAVAEAEAISAPLVAVIEKLLAILPARSLNSLSPKSLIDDLLVIVVGLTQDELEALVNQTLTQLVALANRTVVDAQKIAEGVSANFLTIVNTAIANADARIRAEFDALLALCAPVLGRMGLLVTFEELLAQLEATLAGVNAAIVAANLELQIVLQDSIVLVEVNAVIDSTETRIRDIINGALATAIGGMPVDELGHLAQLVAAEIEELTITAFGEIQRIVQVDGLELLIPVQDIARALFVEIQAQLAPLLDLIGQIGVPAQKKLH